eukprot:350492-Rhodomonas_salina.1
MRQDDSASLVFPSFPTDSPPVCPPWRPAVTYSRCSLWLVVNRRPHCLAFQKQVSFGKRGSAPKLGSSAVRSFVNQGSCK